MKRHRLACGVHPPDEYPPACDAARGHAPQRFHASAGSRHYDGLPLALRAQGVAYAAALQELLAHDRTVFLRALGFREGRKELQIETAAFVDEATEDAVLLEADRLNRSNNHFGLHAFFYRLGDPS